MTLLETLCELQSIDHEWVEKGQQYREVTERLSKQPEIDAERAKRVQIDKDLANKRASMRDQELELGSQRAKLKQIDEDLYSGKVASPRELDNLRREADQVRQWVSDREDSLLELMSAVDDAEATLDTVSQELARMEAAWDGERRQLAAQYQALRARLLAVKERRAALRELLEPTQLGLYDELIARKNGSAMAPVRAGVCQMCRVTVPSHKLTIINTGQTIATCDGCGRILFPG